jgi:hypothetical protein
MITLSEYDLTGEDVLYKREGITRIIYKENQKVVFDTPMFADSIIVTRIGDPNVRLIKEEGWTIQDDDEDVSMTAQILVADNAFDKQLIKSITILEYPYVNFQISIDGQSLYKDQLAANMDIVEWTPQLAQSIIQKVSEHSVLLNPLSNQIAEAFGELTLLAVDAHCENGLNVITGEEHEVNVPGGRHTIIPVNGSFFRDTESLTVVDTGNPLIRDVDYQVINCNLMKTQSSSYVRGVYDAIVVNTSVTGRISINYHAYGGTVSQSDVAQVIAYVSGLMNFQRENSFLSSANLPGVPYLISLKERICQLEENMRILTSIGRPTYADKTNRTAVLKAINSPDDNIHWYNVASLYRVDGSSEDHLIDRTTIRFRTLHSKLMFEANFSLNLIDEVFKVHSISDLNPIAYTPMTDYSNIDNQIIPQFRVIYNDNVEVRSGAILQIGLRLPSVLTETLAVEDLSGDESCWILTPQSDITINPQDDQVILPASAHIWDEASASSVMLKGVFGNDNGYLAWAGNVDIKDYSVDTVLPNLIGIVPIDTIKHIQIDVEDEYGGLYSFEGIVNVQNLTCTITLPTDTGAGFMSFHLSQNLDGSVGLIVESTFIPINIWYLRQVIVHFK